MKTTVTTNCSTGNAWMLLLGIGLFVALTTSSHSVAAQEPAAAATTPAKANFYQIQKNFNDYWKGRKVTKGSGYKPFKRWEWYWESRVSRDGTFPTNDVVEKEWSRFSSLQQTDKAGFKPAGSWTPIGPVKAENRYFGVGRINCIAFHPTNKNIFWVGTPSGGLWKTTDFGKTWTVSANLDQKPVIGVSDIAINPKRPEIMYVATGDGDAANSVAAMNNTGAGDTKSIGILKSKNGGATWDTVKALTWAVSNQVLIARLIMHPANPDTLFVATSSGISYTENGGKTWYGYDKLKDLNFCDITFNTGNPKIMYAATRATEPLSGDPQQYKTWSRIYRSKNGGDTWDSITTLKKVIRVKLAVTPQDSNLLEALCVSDRNGLACLLRFNEKNGQLTLKDTVVKLQKNCGNNYLNGYSAPELYEDSCGGQGSFDLCYLINPVKAEERWLGGVNTYKSVDKGKEFTLVNYWQDSIPARIEQVHADKHWFAFHPLEPGTFFECNDGGIVYTKDGGKKWVDISAGMQIGQIYRIAGSWLEEDVIMAGFQDNGSQVRTAPETWLTPTNIGGDGMKCLTDWYDEKVKYASYAEGDIKRTTDDSWSDKNLKIISKNIPLAPKGAWVTPYLISPEDPATLYAGYRDIWKTTNRGDSWISVFKLPVKQPDSLFRTLAISTTDPKVMWAATGARVYRTKDEWKTWDSVKSMSFPAFRNMVTGIVIHPIKPKTVFITFSGYDSLKVFRTDDGGTNWTNISGDSLPKLPVNCIVYEDGTKDALYIGTDVGVYYKDSIMNNWIQFSGNMPNVMISDLDISYTKGRIRAATFGRGIWESPLYVASGSKKINDIEKPKNGGVATGGGVYPIGSKVKMNAIPAKNRGFSGWYENGIKVHDSASYEFIVQDNRNLVAMFGDPIGFEENQRSDIRIFPNPTTGIVEVKLQAGTSDDLQKTIVTTMQGKNVYESSLKVERDRFSIDLTSCPQGKYLVTFVFKSGGKITNPIVLIK